MAQGAAQQKLAVDSGVWPLYRFDPRRLVKGEPPLHLDYGPPKAKVADYMRNESRFRMVERADPARYKAFVAESQAAAQRRYAVYQQLAGITVPVVDAPRRARLARRLEGEVMDLSTTYLGMRLPHPLIVGAGPLGDDLDTVRELEDAGAALLVLRSLYEEEITGEQMDAFLHAESHSESFAEAESFAPEPLLALGPEEYLEHLRLVKDAVEHPRDRVAQRRHAGRLDLVRAAGRAGRRRRPRAAHLSRGQRHDAQLGRGRAAGRARSCAR